MMSKNKKSVTLAILIVIVLGDFFVWQEMFESGALGGGTNSANGVRDYFLDVGQGDSELIVFPGDIKMMIDAGPDDAGLEALAHVMPPGDDYIDLAIISQPQIDSFNGYNFILDHYRIGAFIYNGRDADPSVSAWPELKAKITAKGIPLITLGAGDKILLNQVNAPSATSSVDEIDILSPNTTFDKSVALNDTGLVELIKTPGFRTLLAADIGANVEDWLVAQSKSNSAAGDVNSIHADILKVANHGSQYSSSDAFLRAISPSVAVIEVGASATKSNAKNAQGQVAASTLARLASDTTALILETNRNGNVEIYSQGNGKLKILKNMAK